MEPMFCSPIPVVFVIPVVSVISVNPAINPLVCGCLSCLRRFCDSNVVIVKSTGLLNIGLAKPRFRNTRFLHQKLFFVSGVFF